MNMTNASDENQVAQPAMVSPCARCKKLEAKIESLTKALDDAHAETKRLRRGMGFPGKCS